MEDPIADVTRKREYAVTPEFSFSRKRRRRANAVAEVGAVEDAVAVGGANEYSRARVRQVNDTMHPFWAVRRMTRSQLAKEIKKTNVQTVPLKFNTELDEFEIEAAYVVSVGDFCARGTFKLKFPFLTNSVPLVANED